MTLRYRLSRLSRPGPRRTFGRTWLVVCLVGAFLTLGFAGGQHLFIVVTVWLVCVFAPVRIAVELLHTHGPRLRDALRRDLERRDDRYDTREHVAVMTEMLFERDVRLPRLAPPDLGAKVTDAAIALCHRAFRTGGGSLGVLQGATTCSALLERWVGTIAAGAPAARPVPPAAAAGRGPATAASNGAHPPALWDPEASIQEQWITLRAVAGMAALAKTLVAVYEDSAGRPMENGTAARVAADTAMDYADQIGLRLEGPPWEQAAGVPCVPLPQELLGRLAETWMAYCEAPLPAPRRLVAFLDSMPQ
ncbi:MAG TPA: hypothetical protein VEZ44_05990 [bacterium]|nr:hypothetical protein [bacterium]